MKALICGGRTYSNKVRMNAVLGSLLRRRGLTMIIEGGQFGADELARTWGLENRVPVVTVLADWLGLGKAAGPMRNRKMLRDYKPDLVVAFPGGRGTANMLKQANAAGIEIMEINP